MSGDKHTAADHAYHGDAPRAITRSRGVHVYLTPEEAATLSLVFAMVGGPPRDTIRKHVISVQRKLKKRGIDWRDYRKDGSVIVSQAERGHEDALYFKPFGQGGDL